MVKTIDVFMVIMIGIACFIWGAVASQTFTEPENIQDNELEMRWMLCGSGMLEMEQFFDTELPWEDKWEMCDGIINSEKEWNGEFEFRWECEECEEV